MRNDILDLLNIDELREVMREEQRMRITAEEEVERLHIALKESERSRRHHRRKASVLTTQRNKKDSQIHDLLGELDEIRQKQDESVEHIDHLYDDGVHHG